MKWYSLRQISAELGMSVNTFKKYYLALFPPDRQSRTYKGYTQHSLDTIKEHILQSSGAN